MKVYTIIDFFATEDYTEPNECWVSNYANKDDAIKGFEAKLNEIEAIGEDGMVVVDDRGNKQSVKELFEGMLTDGFCFDFYRGSQVDRWFVRGQDIQIDFDKERIMWD